MTMFLRLLLIVAVSLSNSWALAQDKDANKDQASKKTAGDSKEAKKEAPKKKAPDKGKSIQAKSRSKNQIRRLLQNSKLPRAWDVAWAAYHNSKHADDKDLRAYAAWAMAVMKGLLGVKGLEGAKEAKDYGCLDWFDKAIEEGWSNPFTFEFASLIPTEIRQSKEFLERVNKLKKQFRDQQAKDIEEKLKQSLANKDAYTITNLPKSLSDKGGYSPDELKDRPVALVITRIHHEGMTEVVDTINKVAEKSESTIPVRTLFYQYFKDDQESIKQTPEYVKHLGLKTKYGIVDRSFVKPLEIPFFPTTLFIDKNGKVLYTHNGLIDELFFNTILSSVIKATGTKAAENAKEESSEEAKEEAETETEETKEEESEEAEENEKAEEEEENDEAEEEAAEEEATDN